MYAFLTLSGLGVVFYLVLLVALYRDGRRRRVSSGAAWKMELGTASESGTRLSQGSGSIAERKRNSHGHVLWIPVTKRHWKPATRNTTGSRAELVCLAKPAHPKDDLQFG